MSKVDEYYSSKDIDRINEEMKSEDAKTKALETEIIRLQQESGKVLLEHGSNSSQFQKIVKELESADERLRHARIVNTAIHYALKQAEKEQRRRVSARIFEENKKIFEKYTKDLPKCPRCNSNEFVSLVEPRGPGSPVDTQPIEYMQFQCDNCGPGGIRFTIMRSEMEGLVGKIEETAKEAAKKLGQVVASVF